MAASEVAGMAIMAFCGVAIAVMVAITQVAKRLDQPYFLLYGTANLIVGAGLWAICFVRGDLARTPRRCWKWVFLRGLFGSSVCMLDLMAVAFGAPLGEKSALMCINIVMSAFLARVFLGEPLRFLHGAALSLSVVGAVMISKPTALLGLEEVPGGVPTLGYATALLAGFVSGGIFIAARKAHDINPLILTAAVATLEGISGWVVPHCGLVVESPMRNMVESPMEASLLLLVLLVLGLTTSGTMSLGSQLCPAAASSTILTSTNMLISFVAQAALQYEMPDLFSLTAAGLMLAGVSLMAFARRLYSLDELAGERESGIAESMPAASATTSGKTAAIEGDEDETESLASFVASEWSGMSPKSTKLRQRVVGDNSAAPEVLGRAGA